MKIPVQVLISDIRNLEFTDTGTGELIRMRQLEMRFKTPDSEFFEKCYVRDEKALLNRGDRGSLNLKIGTAKDKAVVSFDLASFKPAPSGVQK